MGVTLSSSGKSRRITTSVGFLQFENFKDCFIYLLEALGKEGIAIPSYGGKCILNVAYKIEECEINRDLIEILDVPFEWLISELEERLSGKPLNPGRAWEKWTQFYESRLHSGKFSYTTAERIYYQLNEIVAQLKSDPMSRRAVLSIWDPKIDTTSIHEVPSTIIGQFYQHEGKLHAIFFSRSNNCSRLIGNKFSRQSYN